MKGLGKFQTFDFKRFAKDKRFMSIDTQIWKDFDTGEVLGKKVTAVIIEDNTDYGQAKDGTKITNQFEKIQFKVPSQVEVPPNVEIKPVNPSATVYGEFRNQLSITADDIQIVGK